MRSVTRISAALLFASLVFALLERPAHADAKTAIAVDLDGAGVLAGDQRLFSHAYGIGFRLGEEVALPFLRLTPEVGYGYMRFSADRAGADWHTSRVFAGARLGLGELIVPSVFAHVGYGWVNATDESYVGGGTAFDAGVALDLRIAIFGAGLHAAYNTLASDPIPQQWVSAGAHFEIVF